MKRKILTFMLLLVVAGLLMAAGHEIATHIRKNNATSETTEQTIDNNQYYTYSDVEKIVSYLADTAAESEALSRLIDPLKKKRDD